MSQQLSKTSIGILLSRSFQTLCKVTLVGLGSTLVPSIMPIKSFFKNYSNFHFPKKVVCTIQFLNWNGVICKNCTSGCHFMLWLWNQTLTITTKRESTFFEPLLNFLANLPFNHRVLPFVFSYHLVKLMNLAFNYERNKPNYWKTYHMRDNPRGVYYKGI